MLKFRYTGMKKCGILTQVLMCCLLEKVKKQESRQLFVIFIFELPVTHLLCTL